MQRELGMPQGGDRESADGRDLSVVAGVIPRAIHQIFAHLDSINSDCTVKCSFLELYNEELTDLLFVGAPLLLPSRLAALLPDALVRPLCKMLREVDVVCRDRTAIGLQPDWEACCAKMRVA